MTTDLAARLTFTTPPPGLTPLTDFDLADVDGAPGLYTLRDTVGADLRLFLLDPLHYVPDYLPQPATEHLTDLGVDSTTQLDVYVVANIVDGTPVVNLLAPILVNPATGTATQVILEGDDWPLRLELVAA